MPSFLDEWSRRDFLKVAGTAGAGVVAGGLLGCRGTLGDPGRPGAIAPLRSLDAVDAAAVEAFARDFGGAILRPGVSGYDSARRLWNRRFDRHPGLIAVCRDTADVVRAVDFVRSEGVRVSVHGGGHGFGGYAMCDGGVVIDLGEMKSLEVDAAEGVVTAGPGVRLGAIEEAAQSRGLATVTGQCSTVGVGGFTLGGGEGALSRKHGLACDNLLSAQVVLADGEIVTASAAEDPDLYWALRGGGGNFGVVTSFVCRAHPVGEVLAGSLVYPPEAGRAALDAYREAMADAPDELSVQARFVAVPPEPPVFMFHVLYAGDPRAGESAVRALRRHGKPVADTLAPMSYLAAQRLEAPPPPVASAVRTAFFRSLGDELLDVLAASCSRTPASFLAQLVPWGGATTRVERSETAFALREPGYLLLLTADWSAAAEAASARQWVYDAWAALRPFSHGAYVNLLEDEDHERVEEAYDGNYARLARLKATYDPDDLFRSNQNILPAGGSV